MHIDIKKIFLRQATIFLQKTALLSALSCRLVKLTGKHSETIHPKHLLAVRPRWYLSYIKNEHEVLDIGCNNGQHTLKVAKICTKVYGIDRDPEMLAIARREKKRTKAHNLTIIEEDVEDGLPFKKNQFDVILFLDVLEHLLKREFVMGEIKRILKPQGLLLLSVPNSETSWKKLQRSLQLPYFSDPDHKIEFSRDEVVEFLKTMRFKVVSISPVTFDTPFVGFIDLLGGISLTLYSYLAKWRRRMALKYPAESIGLEIVCQNLS